MTVSGSFNFESTAGELINDALEYCGKRDLLQTTSAEVSLTCRKTFNYMIKFWQTQDIGLWLIENLALFLQDSTIQYDIYSSGTHATTSYVKTELSADASSGTGSISVDSITGISASDYIGIELDDGTLQWTTVNGAPSGSTITLTDVLTDTATENAHVYTYTTKAQKPLKIVDAQLYLSSDTEYPLSIKPRNEYKLLANKTAEGKPVQIYEDRRIDRMTVYVWPSPDSVQDYIKMSVRRRIDDIDDLTDTAALPQEWMLALSTNLAYWVAPKFGVGIEKLQILKMLADQTYNAMLMYDQEDTSFVIEPRT